MEKALRSLAADPVPDQIPFRVHGFVRTLRGLWACCDPDCPMVPADHRTRRRPVGLLYDRPAQFCQCGARVLELLYCFHCGDVSLGGYTVNSQPEGRYLASSAVRTGKDVESFIFRRPASVYVWYRPGADAALDRWEHPGPYDSKIRLAFRHVALHPQLGFLEDAPGTPTGVTLGWSGGPEGWTPPALPSRCPACGHREHQGRFRHGVVRSPVRAHTQGTSQAAQLLVDQVVRLTGETPSESKTIVFTDSRDDAAKTAVGLATNHYSDLVRQLVQAS